MQAAAIGEKIVKQDFDVVTFFHNQYEVGLLSTPRCLCLSFC